MGLLSSAVKKCNSKTLLGGGSSSPCGVHSKQQPSTPDKHRRLRKKRFWRKKKSSKKFGCVPCVSLTELTRRAECEAIADLVNNISAKSGNQDDTRILREAADRLV